MNLIVVGIVGGLAFLAGHILGRKKVEEHTTADIIVVLVLLLISGLMSLMLTLNASDATGMVAAWFLTIVLDLLIALVLLHWYLLRRINRLKNIQ